MRQALSLARGRPERGRDRYSVQPKRDCFAAIRFFRKLLEATGGCRLRVIVTDRLRSYGAAKRVVMPGVAHGTTVI